MLSSFHCWKTDARSQQEVRDDNEGKIIMASSQAEAAEFFARSCEVSSGNFVDAAHVSVCNNVGTVRKYITKARFIRVYETTEVESKDG